MIVPSLSTLFSDAAGKVLCNLSPLCGPQPTYEFKNQVVFLIAPGTLNQIGVKDLLPTMETLHVGAPWEAFCDFLPVLAHVFFDRFPEYGVFGFSPVALGGPILILGWTCLVQLWIIFLSLANFLQKVKINNLSLTSVASPTSNCAAYFLGLKLAWEKCKAELSVSVIDSCELWESSKSPG